MRKFKIAALSAAAALALAGCGAAPEKEGTSESSAASGDAATFKACMVSDQGGFDDKSFNESGMEGMEKAKAELGVEIASAESSSDADFTNNVASLVSQKCNLIIGVGFLLNDAIRDAAKANPDINFALIDSQITEGTGADTKVVSLPNAKPLVFNTAEAGFLAGYAAAAVSKTGTVSAFGGISLPSVNIFMDGYAEGVAKYNEDNGKSVKIIGWDVASQNGAFVGNFEDQSKGKQLTEQQISQGSDVIMPVAGPVGKGTLAAVAGTENMVVGVDSDWAVQYPESEANILTSVVKEIGQAVFDTIKEAQSGNFTSEAYVGTLANKGVDIAPFHAFEDKVPAEVKAKIDEYRKAIADGTQKVESVNNP